MSEQDFQTYNRDYARMGNIPPNWDEAERNSHLGAATDAWLPTRKDARILDFGCGTGNQLLALWCAGYRNLEGVEISQTQAETAQRCAGGRVPIHCGDGAQYLAGKGGRYDLVLMMDVVEHIPREQVAAVLVRIHEAMAPGGRVVLRTPNMACLLAPYSRYLDVTHLTGYTDFSLVQILENAGFVDARFVPDWSFSLARWRPWVPWRNLGLRAVANRILHKTVYWIRGHTPVPRHFGMNLVAYATKPETSAQTTSR